MTSPLTPEAVAQMVADREAGTPGPWRESQTWRPPIGNGPHSDMVNGNIFWGYSISGSNEGGGHIYPTLAAVHNFPDHIHANARRIASLPDLEAAYLTLAAENATLRASEAAALERVKVLEEALMIYADSCDETETKSCGYDGNMCCRSARAALTHTADKEPKT